MKSIHTCPAGTAAIYKPECLSDCNDINCTACVFDIFRSRGDNCPFRRYITAYPIKKPIYTDKSSNILQDQRSAQDILNMCTTLQANTLQAQVEPLQNMVNVLDLIIEITEKQDELTKMRQGQPVPEHPDDKLGPSEMTYVNEKPLEEGQAGDLWDLSYVLNRGADAYDKDFYHHCPAKYNELVRLNYLPFHQEHICPICKQVYVPK